MRYLQRFPVLGSCVRAVTFTVVATAMAWVMDGAYSLASQAMAYLLAVVFSAFRFGRRDAVLTAAASVVALNFFFIPPRYTFAVESPDYLVTLGALLLVSLIISGLAAELKSETAQARLRELRARQLHVLADTLAGALTDRDLLLRAADAVYGALGRSCYLQTVGSSGSITAEEKRGDIDIDSDAVRCVFEQRRPIGPTTDLWPDLLIWYVPVPGDEGAFGVIAMKAARDGASAIAEELRDLQAFARQIGLALQRAQLTRKARTAALEAEAESMRNALLASISHDLRTPLAAILGSATTLCEQHDRLSNDEQQALLHTIEDEAVQMSATAENVLQLARLSSGNGSLRRDWESLEEMVGSVVGRFRRRGESRIRAAVPSGLPLVHVDAVLIAQILGNLLENAVRYAPADTLVDVSAHLRGNEIVVAVEDRGPGFGDGERDRLFGKLEGVGARPSRGGAGLGLAICKAIVGLHGGRIHARNREGGGAKVEFTLPCSLNAPAVEDDGASNDVNA
jgi:two-component system sensor histidine kinase KdpD